MIALIAFWVLVIKTWITDGPRVPLIFIVLWFGALFGFRALGWSAYLFVAFEAVLSVLLIMKNKLDSVV